MLIGEMEKVGETLGAVREQIRQVFFGQDRVVDEVLTVLLAGGHVLLVGVPGLGKTLLVETLSRVLGLDSRRVQFTPDLMPADILGSEVLEEGEDGRRGFRFLPGPIFTQLLMGDEINRASPRTQSALLQAMQEGTVTIAGHGHALPKPFHVLATQNPIEQEGTYPLPEAQLDRFLCQIDIHYPDLESEREIVLKTTGLSKSEVKARMNGESLLQAQSLTRQVPVGESVVESILRMVRNGRPETSDLDVIRDRVSWGPGPRASQALMLACRARALLQGRLAPSGDDVAAMAKPVLRHRMALSFAARAEGYDMDGTIDALVEASL
ncbi:MoxR family ATPase [Rhodospirillaceae bacterium KN72]|uniref:MoxR family ATPase n=1 Tax=Pacificispira spongiicola TaxID=2729598 RepID=A0A7Y0HET2_9PROT|nr:MoxR family ATPase [Pacificispira spongiicola]NMM45201.1 MoxR family ATPase [Pacificispira spongiicola]